MHSKPDSSNTVSQPSIQSGTNLAIGGPKKKQACLGLDIMIIALGNKYYGSSLNCSQKMNYCSPNNFKSHNFRSYYPLLIKTGLKEMSRLCTRIPRARAFIIVCVTWGTRQEPAHVINLGFAKCKDID